MSMAAGLPTDGQFTKNRRCASPVTNDGSHEGVIVVLPVEAVY